MLLFRTKIRLIIHFHVFVVKVCILIGTVQVQSLAYSGQSCELATSLLPICSAAFPHKDDSQVHINPFSTKLVTCLAL